MSLSRQRTTLPIARPTRPKAGHPRRSRFQRPLRLPARAQRQAQRDRHREPALLPSATGHGGRGGRLPRLLHKPVARQHARLPDDRPAGRKATESKRCLLVNFQNAANEFYQEAVGRVHAGDIGPVVTGEAAYYCRRAGVDPAGKPALGLPNPENRIRMAAVNHVLSGDIITEQNIHVLDVAAWLLDAAPVKAVGFCGKKGRIDQGTNHDHFNVVFTFPNDVVVSFISKQFGAGSEEIGCCMFGPRGTVDTHYYGLVYIRGEKSYKGGKLKNLYADGAAQNIANFHQSIMPRRLLQSYRGPQRPQQPDHDPGSHGRLPQGRNDLGRNDENRREAGIPHRRAEDLIADFSMWKGEDLLQENERECHPQSLRQVLSAIWIASVKRCCV